MGKIVYLAILAVVVIVFFRKIMKPSVGSHFQLKTILFVMGVKKYPRQHSLAGTYFRQRQKEN